MGESTGSVAVGLEAKKMVRQTDTIEGAIQVGVEGGKE